jgi:hypothetical protein
MAQLCVARCRTLLERVLQLQQTNLTRGSLAVTK